MKMFRRSAEGILNDPPALLLPFLLLLSLLYRGGVFLHRWIYDAGLVRRERLPRPVISVGNLTVGGGGKTPFIMSLARELLSRGVRPAVLSRGYGRKGQGPEVVGEDDHWSRYGDEPFLLANRLKIPVVVSRNRYSAGMKALEKGNVDLFILDDGFQHRALYRDLDIVVVDGQRRFGKRRLLPAGFLREPVSRLGGADLIVVTKVAGADPLFEEELKEHKDLPVVWADFRPAGLVPRDASRGTGGSQVPPGPALGFCGIAHPDGFRHSLERAGIDIARFLVFPDHHAFTMQDVGKITSAAREAGVRFMVTTEKDAVRWPGDQQEIPLYCLSMEMIVHEGKEKLMESIESLVSGQRAAT